MGRIKVGTEWVTKGQTCEQAASATGGVARAIFDRLFKWLIEMCNDTLIDSSMKKANFCAVLDIAGFEIFEYNGFEQISINFVNEKLQQFFNHHMFVVVEELLQLLVDKVDGDLFKAVVFKDLESGNVEHSAEVGLLHGGVNKGVVTLDDQPLEDAVKDGPGNTSGGTGGLVAGLTLGHPLSSDLDPGLAEGLEHDLGVNTKGSSCLTRERLNAVVSNLSLVVATLGLINDSTAGHHTGGQHVAIKLPC